MYLVRYIAFCRQKVHPRLSPDACETLKNHYVNIRSQVAASKKLHGDAPIPITVRQLEAITRISEALARVQLHQHGNGSAFTLTSTRFIMFLF